ncbi:MAG: tetratricopeptide repeat protein, partial [Alphaproteobacteria bacterium]|nr:tetratricopeptide repeat protein [Alphaproteobacteria bacterium]
MAKRRRTPGRSFDAAAAFNKALAHQRAGRWQQAAGVYRKILVRDPGNLQAEAQLALAQLHARDYDRAARGAERLLKRLPDRAALHNLLGAAQRAMGRHEQAVAAFRQAIALDPNFPDAHNNLGATLVATGDVAEAIPVFERAIELAPSRLAARINLVEALLGEEDYEKAVSVMAPLAERAPNDRRVLMNRYMLASGTCDLAALPAVTAKLDTALAAAFAANSRPAETPFTNVARKADPEQNLAVARAWSAAIAARAATEEPKPHQRAKSADQRLRIGYLSGDFRDHPVARLLGGLFGRHDRSAFHVTAYSHGT